jgi:hypothetical protein
MIYTVAVKTTAKETNATRLPAIGNASEKAFLFIASSCGCSSVDVL